MIQKRLLHLAEFEDYRDLMAVSWPPLRPAEEREQEFWVYEKQQLDDSVTERKRLETEETTLQTDIERLQQRRTEAKTRLNEEQERLRRHPMLEEHRRVKDEESKQKRLQELEETMRRSIRLELEREMEIARRLMLRTKRHQHFNVAISDDERVEFT
ncbi:hypothetical protein DVH05_013712 [Phytophthora capsici]|nr:hypothetical protein DVH05_013712 [Phytophthora capsici]